MLEAFQPNSAVQKDSNAFSFVPLFGDVLRHRSLLPPSLAGSIAVEHRGDNGTIEPSVGATALMPSSFTIIIKFQGISKKNATFLHSSADCGFPVCRFPPCWRKHSLLLLNIFRCFLVQEVAQHSTNPARHNNGKVWQSVGIRGIEQKLRQQRMLQSSWLVQQRRGWRSGRAFECHTQTRKYHFTEWL